MAEAEAAIMSEVAKLSSLVEKVNLEQDTMLEVENIINEMKLFLGLVRDKKLEEGSCRLNCLISEIVEMSRNAHHLTADGHMQSFRREVEETNDRLRELGSRRSKNNHIEGVELGDHVVELKEEVELLFQKMNTGSFGGPFVACIKGIAGSGKTALARQLYGHADVAQKFERRAWVNCTELLSRKELLINLIRQLAIPDGGVEEMESRSLREMLARQLRGKPYFIVLDDVWRREYLTSVIQYLPRDDKESRLLLTSHTEIIVRAGSPFVHYLHDMKPLDLDKSWQLLLKTIFSGNNKFPKQLERKGKVMLMKHSGGVPLAVKEVGMEWAEKRRLGSEWEEIVGSDDLELRTSLDALELSWYNKLDRDLKPCFIHLSFFKEGTTIRAEKLVQTWIAGSVVSRDEEDDRICLTKLIQQNVIEVKDKAKIYGTRNCLIRPIFHKLSISKAKEGNTRASQEPRHRVIYCSRERFNNCPTKHDKHLVSLFFRGGGCFDSSPSYWICFEKLQLLEFEGFGLKFLPKAVGELTELRYLGLRNNYINELPRRSLARLKDLEVLDVELNFMVEVPDIIWEMKYLRHLYMSDIICREPLKIEGLKNLKTLTYISVDNWAYEMSGIRMMTSLIKLGIEELDENSNVSELFASLAALKNLNCLMLRGFRFRSMPSLEDLGNLRGVTELKLDGLITRLPGVENLPPCLNYLTLVNSNLDEDPMPVLEKVWTLIYLKLQNAYSGRQMVISDGGFPKLYHLCITELWHLRNIQVGDGAMRNLENLEICSCPCLHSLPKEMITKHMQELIMVTTKKIATKTKQDLFSNIPIVDILP